MRQARVTAVYRAKMPNHFHQCEALDDYDRPQNGVAHGEGNFHRCHAPVFAIFPGLDRLDANQRHARRDLRPVSAGNIVHHSRRTAPPTIAVIKRGPSLAAARVAPLSAEVTAAAEASKSRQNARTAVLLPSGELDCPKQLQGMPRWETAKDTMANEAKMHTAATAASSRGATTSATATAASTAITTRATTIAGRPGIPSCTKVAVKSDRGTRFAEGAGGEDRTDKEREAEIHVIHCVSHLFATRAGSAWIRRPF